MKTEKLLIGGIPSILWGEKCDKLYIHVHGKMSCKENAKTFAEIAYSKGFQTLSFDLPLHGERTNDDYICDITNGMADLAVIGEYAFLHWKDVSLFACSLGAFFSLNAYADKKFSNCLFQSPIIDMPYLIEQMFGWFNVTKQDLVTQKEIVTPFETLRLDYYEYVIKHPITKWDSPTKILFAGKDNMQTIDIINKFTAQHGCKLTVCPQSEHPFMQNSDIPLVQNWFLENI